MSSNQINYQDDPNFNTEQIVNDNEPLTVEQKYNKIIADRKRVTAKYHKSDKGKASLKMSSKKYYLKHKAKILAKKREKYLQAKLDKQN